jgi:murein DD-endopeptidase MepM/ murein hydrolase activator NlpD
MSNFNPIVPLLKKHERTFYPVVNVRPTDKLLPMDFTEANTSLTADIASNTGLFCDYITHQLTKAGARFGIGGYNELRTVYARSDHFGTEGELRRLHIGVDVWGAAGTPVYAFMGGMVHSFAFNNKYGDYGATLILSHQLEGLSFYTLYGHLSEKDIQHLSAGNYLVRGQEIAHFGKPEENGHWPPHLHLQIIVDIGVWEGDYPGVCKKSESNYYLYNCPNPELIMGINGFSHQD